MSHYNSYKSIIMKKLIAGEYITPLTALKDFGCLSLPQRICELRAEGVPICGVSVKNGKKRHHQYWLEPQDRAKYAKQYAVNS